MSSRGALALLLSASCALAACSSAPPAVAPAVKPAKSAAPIANQEPEAAQQKPSELEQEDIEPPKDLVEIPKGSPPPTESEATTIWNEVVTLARESKPRTLKCHRVISSTTRLAFATTPQDLPAVKRDMTAYLRIARCAEQLQSFGFLEQLGRVMLRADPANGHPELVARALLGKHQTQGALQALETAAQKSPKDPYLAITVAKVHCSTAKWPSCKEAAENAIALAQTVADKDEQRRIIAGAHKYAARALAHTGALDDASKRLEQAEKLQGKWSDIEDIRDEIAMAKRFGTIVDLDPDVEVLLGAYHLVGKLDNLTPMLRVNLVNLEDDEARYRVEVEIAGVAQPTSETVTVKKKGSRYVDFNPSLRGDFDINKIRASQPTNITVKVSKLKAGGDELVIQQSVKTNLLPRDYLPMGSFADELGRFFTRDSRFVAAWVTPNDKSVDTFLTEAKKRLKRGQSFNGPQSETMSQVKALFEALRARGVSYVMDPEVLSKDVKSQRTRLPSEVLASTNAQCLEGSILYATLLEAIGLEPAVVYVPGHAFVAWKPSKFDKSKEKWFFLETTMTGGTLPFEKAVERAKTQFATHDPKKHAHVADIALLRKGGISAQPSQYAADSSAP